MQATDRKRTSHDVRRVPVMLPYPFPGPFDYRVRPEWTLNPATSSWFR